MRRCINASRKFEGVIRYDLIENDKSNFGSSFTIFAVYANEEAKKIHLESPHILAVLDDFKNGDTIQSLQSQEYDAYNIQD